jgi:hypothetical protein
MKNLKFGSIMALVFLAATSLSAQTATTTTTAAATSHWTVVPSPNVSGQDNILAAVAANSATDIWAVGQFIPDANQDLTQTLIEHWDGTSVTAVASPNVGNFANALFAVTAKGGLAWAVGYFIDANSNFNAKSLILAWDGKNWNLVSHPHVGTADQFFGVSAISPTDIWAVGATRDSSGKFTTLTEHFDGNDWDVVSSPNPGATSNQLHAVRAVSANSVWAVGFQTGNQGPDIPVIEHWNGSQWSVVNPPSVSKVSTYLFGVSAVSDASVLAVGDKQDNIHNPKTLAEAGANGTFSVETADNVGTGENHLYGAAAFSDSLAFAVGDALDPTSGNFNNLVERCTSSGCSTETVPNPSQGGNDQLGGVVVLSATEAWAVGTFDGPNAPQTLVLHRTQ